MDNVFVGFTVGLAVIAIVAVIVFASDNTLMKTADCAAKQGVLVKIVGVESRCIRADIIDLNIK